MCLRKGCEVRSPKLLAMWEACRTRTKKRRPESGCKQITNPRLAQYIGVYIGIMEKKVETTMVYWGYIGIMEKKMETTIVYWGLYRDNGKENGNCYSRFPPNHNKTGPSSGGLPITLRVPTQISPNFGNGKQSPKYRFCFVPRRVYPQTLTYAQKLSGLTIYATPAKGALNLGYSIQESKTRIFCI